MLLSIRYEAEASRGCGLLPLPKGEGGVRGYKLSIDPNPLTPTLSPAGRGSPAVPQSNAALITQACVNPN